MLPFFILTIFAAALLTTVYKDVTTMTIPNWTSLLVLGSFFVVIPFVWPGLAVFGEHMASGGLMFLLGFFLFAMGWLGGGDAKLMAAISFWWTFPDMMTFIFYSTVAGGVLAACILSARRFMPVRLLTHQWMHRLIKDDPQMPYGLALAFGAFVTLPQSEIFLRAAGLS